jgi:WD40 repeat protein
VTGLAVSGDGQTCLSKDFNGKIKQWKFKDGKEFPVCSHLGFPHTYAIAMNSNGQIFAISSSTEILINRIDNGEKVYSLKRHLDTVDYLKFSANGEVLISAGRDQKVMVWQPLTGEWTQTLDLNNGRHLLKTVEVSSDGDTIISGWPDGAIQIWQR